MTEDYTTWTDEALRDLATAVTTEQERRRTIREARDRIDEIVDEFEAATEGNAPVAWETLTDRVAPGQRVIWTDGNVWRNRSKAWLPSTANPETYPLGWAQESGLPPDVAAWDGNGHAYKAGDLCSYQGVTYRVLQAHTSQPHWTPNIVPALYTPQGAA